MDEDRDRKIAPWLHVGRSHLVGFWSSLSRSMIGKIPHRRRRQLPPLFWRLRTGMDVPGRRLLSGFGRRSVVAVWSIPVGHKDVCLQQWHQRPPGPSFSISPTRLPLPHTPKATAFSRLNQSAHATSPASCGLSYLSSAASKRLYGCGWHQRPRLSSTELWSRRGQRPDRYCLDLNGHLWSISVPLIGRVCASRMYCTNGSRNRPNGCTARCNPADPDLVKNNHGDAPPAALSTDHDLRLVLLFHMARTRQVSPDNE
jgi:hypothetical protein